VNEFLWRIYAEIMRYGLLRVNKNRGQPTHSERKGVWAGLGVLSAVRHIEVSVMRVWAAPRITVHEGIGRGVILTVPRTIGDTVPIPIRVDTGDVWVIDLAGYMHPRSGTDERSHTRCIVVIRERIDAMMALLLAI
jgi:hypothetical protein